MSYYIVERSTDGFTFTPMQQTEAKKGMVNTYTATDTHVPRGLVYYRLQSVEKNGSVNYSNIISFKKANAQPFSVYPTLITGNTAVSVTCSASGHTTFIRVVGVNGKVWQTVPVAAGLTKTSIDLSSLTKGTYFVVFAGSDNVVTTKIWKE
jgi:predicted Zn-dependent protease